MESAQIITDETHQPRIIAEPQPGMQVEAHIITRNPADGSESVRRHAGEIRRADEGTVLIVPEEGPWVVACVGKHFDAQGNEVSTEITEVAHENQQFSLI